jgi:hypothetical protein
MGAAGRILLGIVLTACLLGLAVLEVVSERVRVEPVSATEPSADSEVWERIEQIVVLGGVGGRADSPER